jgi:hypothetical protein
MRTENGESQPENINRETTRERELERRTGENIHTPTHTYAQNSREFKREDAEEGETNSGSRSCCPCR